MSDTGQRNETDLFKKVGETLARYPELMRPIPKGLILYRVQPSRYDGAPIHYRRESDTRYADPCHEVGVKYLGFSPEVAVAESFQSGQDVDDQPVRISLLRQSSIHRLRAFRDLSLVDVAGLANRATSHKLRHLIQAKGQGREGYALTRIFSQACMKQGNHIDGLLYPSAVYSPSGTLDGCNVVLFEGRSSQLASLDCLPVSQMRLSNGESVYEFLDSLGVAME